MGHDRGGIEMYAIGDNVRVRISGIGYRVAVITRPALNSYWVRYNGNEYLISVKFLDKWRKEK